MVRLATALQAYSSTNSLALQPEMREKLAISCCNRYLYPPCLN